MLRMTFITCCSDSRLPRILVPLLSLLLLLQLWLLLLLWAFCGCNSSTCNRGCSYTHFYSSYYKKTTSCAAATTAAATATTTTTTTTTATTTTTSTMFHWKLIIHSPIWRIVAVVMVMQWLLPRPSNSGLKWTFCKSSTWQSLGIL